MEEDIKIIENAIKEVEDNKDMGFFQTEEDLNFYNAVKSLLNLYNKAKITIEENQLAFKKQTENLREVEELYNKEKEKNIASSKVIVEQCDYIQNKSINIEKIIESIKTLNKLEKQELKGTKGQDRYNIKQEYMYKRSGLQELLESEE